jgi:hypothetical protein
MMTASCLDERPADRLKASVVEKPKDEVCSANRGAEFEKLKGFLTGDMPKVPYRQVALELRLSEEAVKTSGAFSARDQPASRG